MKPFVGFVLALVSLLGGVAHAAPTPLIPRALLFGNAERQYPLISPDGSQISWLAPDEHGVMNVWAQAEGGDSARAVTRELRPTPLGDASGAGHREERPFHRPKHAAVLCASGAILPA